jgi:4-diphosphocytidyl-2-C-methyl-D-erythritol kinase
MAVGAFAPAKVNLALRVLGRRADGYHELDTWMLALEWGDTLILRRRTEPGLSLAVHGRCASADIPSDARNLVWRAAELVLARARPQHGIAIELEKAVPSQAGLGAGSADAAAAWLGAERLLGLRSPNELAHAELATLGSDCVFFALAQRSGLAHCTARGDVVAEQPLPDETRRNARFVAILVPSVPCPTGAVYRAVRQFAPGPMAQAPGPMAQEIASVWFERPIAHSRAALVNDLEAAALTAVPQLVPWRTALDESGAQHWRLSGSGSAFFTLHESRSVAEEELARLLAELGARGLVPRAATLTRPQGAGARTWTIS